MMINDDDDNDEWIWMNMNEYEWMNMNKYE